MRTDVRRDAAATGRDQFPVGMWVLAVDDDPACLKVLETLLRRCQYHVTATNQAVIALRMMRENRAVMYTCETWMALSFLELVGLEWTSLSSLLGLTRSTAAMDFAAARAS